MLLFFFDTGSSVNLIKESLVKRLSEKSGIKIRACQKSLKSVTNHTLRVTGEINLIIYFGDVMLSDNFIIVDEEHYPGCILLGFKSMEKHNISVDPPQSKVAIGGREIPMLQWFSKGARGEGNSCNQGTDARSAPSRLDKFCESNFAYGNYETCDVAVTGKVKP